MKVKDIFMTPSKTCNNYKELTECLCCGSDNLFKFLDLGVQPLANNLKNTSEEEKELYPLALNVCQDCWHSQLTIAVDPALLYAHYLYVSGTTKTLNDFFLQVATDIDERLWRSKKVLDIACNDGTFLEKFKTLGWQCYGIDPAKNLMPLCEQKDIKVQNAFFAGKDYVRPVEKFDVITCFNVVAHIPNPLDFLKEAKEIINDEGSIFVQTSQRDMIIQNQFDTVYHEHHSFFSLLSFEALFKRAGLYIHEVTYTDIHGGSYLVEAKKYPLKKSRIVSKVEQERDEGRYGLKLYLNFQQNVLNLKEKLLREISLVQSKGYRVVGFGAAAKGIVLLNYYDIKPEFVIDENVLKHNKIIPNIELEVKLPEHVVFKDGEKVCFLILAWNFFDEIKRKILARYTNIQPVFIKPFPQITVYEA